ncbi:MAG: hypothetical protein V4490_01785 [Pseudomonadota bacterium]
MDNRDLKDQNTRIPKENHEEAIPKKNKTRTNDGNKKEDKENKEDGSALVQDKTDEDVRNGTKAFIQAIQEALKMLLNMPKNLISAPLKLFSQKKKKPEEKIPSLPGANKKKSEGITPASILKYLFKLITLQVFLKNIISSPKTISIATTQDKVRSKRFNESMMKHGVNSLAKKVGIKKSQRKKIQSVVSACFDGTNRHLGDDEPNQVKKTNLAADVAPNTAKAPEPAKLDNAQNTQTSPTPPVEPTESTPSRVKVR